MVKFFQSIFIFFPVFFISGLLFAQPGTYILNGSAVQNTCNCYTLTPALNTQSGSVWNASKMNLNLPFDYVFNVFLGCTDALGADGIVFMLQPISTSVGTSGEGMGFEGISPSVGISLDTWQNTNLNDPGYDHISIQSNGNISHGTDVAGPIQASAENSNIEDCQWHTFRISWDPVSLSLKTYFDGMFRLEKTINLITTVFNNDPWVYWGFSAGTGGYNNLQQFCTALNPDFNTNMPSNGTCLGNTISFINTSQSFAPIASYYWDFADGNTTTLANPPPHLYAAPGIYTVKLAITGLDRCNSDTLRKVITVGDYPIANFDVYDTCAGLSPRIIDRSLVTIGTISQWSWLVDGIPVSVSQQPQLTNLAPGVHQLQLTVTSNHGCTSAPVNKQFTIKDKPAIIANALNGCIDEPVFFSATQTDNLTTITQWRWQFGDNQTSTLQNPQHSYSVSKNYIAQVFSISATGCQSDIITIPVFINKAIAHAGNDTVVIKNFPFQLQALGGIEYRWSPPTGLNNTTIANPEGSLQDNITYTLSVTTAEGCTDEDQVSITVFKGSAVYVPSGFTPNNDGLNDRLKPYYVGIRSLEYFTVYNRWGEVVFSTKDLSGGWNGLLKGLEQPSGIYVWMLKATDYVNKQYEMKGTSTIIR